MSEDAVSGDDAVEDHGAAEGRDAVSDELEPKLSAEESWRRTSTALGIALPIFAVAHVAGMFLALPMIQDRTGTWEDLAFAAVASVYGVLAFVLLVPVAVLTIGRLVDSKTWNWPVLSAAARHGQVGLGLGLVVAVVLGVGGLGGWLPLTLAFALPPAVTAFVTHLIVPHAMRNRAIGAAGWVVTGLIVVYFMGNLLPLFG